MRRVDRRTFLKRLGVASAAAAAAGAVPGMVFPTDAILRPGGQSGPVWKKTPCRLCGVGCGLLVAIENGRAVAVKGDPDSPVSKGLACVKGYNSVQALYGRDRLAHAKVRRDGALVEVPLNETLDLVARSGYTVTAVITCLKKSPFDRFYCACERATESWHCSVPVI